MSNDNKVENQTINNILEFIINLPKNYAFVLNQLEQTSIRFCDYYDPNICHTSEITKYFEDNYFEDDKENMTIVFAMYVFLKNANDIVEGLKFTDDIEELYNLLDNNYFFEDIVAMINYLNEKVKLNDNSILFNKNTNFPVLFTGFIGDDIKAMEKSTKKSFIKKVVDELANIEQIPLAEGVESICAAYDFPLLRVHFAGDYRLAFIRENTITVVLGAVRKSGKDSDYRRYDKIARNKEKIYREIELFVNNMLPKEHEHYKIVRELTDFYKKEVDQVSIPIRKK